MEVSEPHRWNALHITIVFLVMIAGAALAVIWPVWLVPPNVASTVWLYLGLAVLWFPLLIILVLVFPRGSRGSVILLIVVGAVALFFVLGLAGPHIGWWAAEAKDCTSKVVSPGVTEYTCKKFGLGPGAVETMVLQGATGSPYARAIPQPPPPNIP